MSFKSEAVFAAIKAGLASLPAAEREKQVKKTGGVFKFEVSQGSAKKIWYIDLKKEGKVGEGDTDADVTIMIKDNDMVDLATGKLEGQQAFMMGVLKLDGNIMLAMKLGSVLQAVGPAAKL